jgi:hypothetical protein
MLPSIILLVCENISLQRFGVADLFFFFLQPLKQFITFKSKRFMNYAKKILLTGFLLVVGTLSRETIAQRKTTHDETIAGARCRVEIISCGWFSGSRQVCHQNGGGLSCNCGESTVCK